MKACFSSCNSSKLCNIVIGISTHIYNVEIHIVANIYIYIKIYIKLIEVILYIIALYSTDILDNLIRDI